MPRKSAHRPPCKWSDRADAGLPRENGKLVKCPKCGAWTSVVYHADTPEMIPKYGPHEYGGITRLEVQDQEVRAEAQAKGGSVRVVSVADANPGHQVQNLQRIESICSCHIFC